LRGVDSFFGLNGFNAAYHLPSDGNIRALLNRDAIKTDVISSISAEVYFLNKKVNVDGFFDERIINSEIALFSDVGLFQADGEMKSVASFGLGFRFSGKFFNKPLYLRVDCPLILIDGEEISNDKSLILSFHRSI
jgi:hypothetical protein